MSKTNFPASLPTIFTNPQPWKHVDRYVYLNSTARIAVVLATKAPNRDNHALNKAELLRVIAGKRDGKIDEAYVVAARINVDGSKTYVCAGIAGEVFARIEHRPTISGMYGEFWVLQEYDIDSNTEL